MVDTLAWDDALFSLSKRGFVSFIEYFQLGMLYVHGFWRGRGKVERCSGL